MSAPAVAPVPSRGEPTTAPGVSSVDAAVALGPLLRRRAAAAEAASSQPSDVVAAIEDAGLFRLGTPAGLGGLEVEPPAIVETIEAVSRADGSAGWTTLIGNSGLFLAWMDQGLAAGLLDGHPEAAMTGAIAPEGRAVPEPGGLRLSGRWRFMSGCPHARVFSSGFLVTDGPGTGPPRMIGDRPDWRWAVYPATAAEIVPTWTDAVGLRGTGSHDVVVEGLLVPEGHTVMPFYDPPVVDGALFRMPFFSLLKVLLVGVPLGVARHALDAFGEYARTKVRSGPGPIAAEDDVQIRYGIAEASVRAARAHVLDEVRRMWATVQAGDDPTDADRGALTLAVSGAFRTCLAAVDDLFALAGAGALYAGDEIQRCWRDLHAAAAHRAVGRAQWQGGAKALLGLPVDRAWL